MEVTIIADSMNKEIDVRVQISHGDMVSLRSPESQLVQHLTRAGATKIELLQALVIIAGGPPPARVFRHEDGRASTRHQTGPQSLRRVNWRFTPAPKPWYNAAVRLAHPLLRNNQ